MRPGNDGGSVILERNVQRGEEFDEVALAIGALTGGSVGLDPSAASPGEVAQFDALATWLIMQGSVDADVELTVEEVQILQRAIAATEKNVVPALPLVSPIAFELGVTPAEAAPLAQLGGMLTHNDTLVLASLAIKSATASEVLAQQLAPYTQP